MLHIVAKYMLTEVPGYQVDLIRKDQNITKQFLNGHPVNTHAYEYIYMYIYMYSQSYRKTYAQTYA